MSSSKEIQIPGVSSSIAKALPVFLVKLLKMLEDIEIDTMIRWDDSGKSFHINDTSGFCDVVLPQYFKHRNLNSFVRQLNFYGFRKLAASDRSTLQFMDSGGDDLHFMHPKFIRGWPDLMFEIKRQTNPTKKLTAAVPEMTKTSASVVSDNDGKYVSILQDDFTEMLSNLRLLNQRTDELEYTVRSLHETQDVMWQEMRILRETNMKQTACFNKLISFLISVLNPTTKARINARRSRPFVDNGISDQLVVAPRHGGDVLACIQNEIKEFTRMHKMSSLDPDNKDGVTYFDEGEFPHEYFEEMEQDMSSPVQQQLVKVMPVPKNADVGMLFPANNFNQLTTSQQIVTLPKPVKPITYTTETPRFANNNMFKTLPSASSHQYFTMPSTSRITASPGTVMKTTKNEPSYFDDCTDDLQQNLMDALGVNGTCAEEELIEFLDSENINHLDSLMNDDSLWTNSLMELSPH